MEIDIAPLASQSPTVPRQRSRSPLRVSTAQELNEFKYTGPPKRSVPGNRIIDPTWAPWAEDSKSSMVPFNVAEDNELAAQYFTAHQHGYHLNEWRVIHGLHPIPPGFEMPRGARHPAAHSQFGILLEVYQTQAPMMNDPDQHRNRTRRSPPVSYMLRPIAPRQPLAHRCHVPTCVIKYKFHDDEHSPAPPSPASVIMPEPRTPVESLHMEDVQAALPQVALPLPAAAPNPFGRPGALIEAPFRAIRIAPAPIAVAAAPAAPPGGGGGNNGRNDQDPSPPSSPSSSNSDDAPTPRRPQRRDDRKAAEADEKKEPPAVPRHNHVPRRQWHVNYYLTDVQEAWLRREFPELDIVVGPNSRRHTHPLSAIERAYSEAVALETLAAYGAEVVLDVGGNPQRHANRVPDPNRPVPRVWSCCPVLSAEDAVRNKEWTVRGVPNWCDHVAQDCDCVAFDAVLFVHSAYYLDPAMIDDLVARSLLRMGVSVHHSFPEAFGYMWAGGGKMERDYIEQGKRLTHRDDVAQHMEAMYVMAGDNVRMTIHGQSRTYDHNSLTWIARRSHGSVEATGGRFSAVEKAAFGHSVVYLMTHSDEPVVSPAWPAPLDLYTAVKDPLYYGKVILKGVSIGAELSTNAAFERVTSHGTWFTTATGIVPKGLIEQVATRMVGKERTSTSLRQCVDTSSSLVRQYNLPPQLAMQAVILGGYLGYVYSVREESTALTHFIRPRDEELHELNTLNRTEPAPDVSPVWPIIGLSAIAVAAVAHSNRKRARPMSVYDAITSAAPDPITVVTEVARGAGTAVVDTVVDTVARASANPWAVAPLRDTLSVPAVERTVTRARDTVVAAINTAGTAVRTSITGFVSGIFGGALNVFNDVNSTFVDYTDPAVQQVIIAAGPPGAEDVMRVGLDRIIKMKQERVAVLEHYRKVFSQYQTQMNAVQVVLLAPVLEEAIKRVPYLRWIMALEAYTHVSTGHYSDAVFSAAFHVVTAQMHYRPAVLVHMAWNLYSFVQAIERSRGPQPMGVVGNALAKLITGPMVVAILATAAAAYLAWRKWSYKLPPWCRDIQFRWPQLCIQRVLGLCRARQATHAERLAAEYRASRVAIPTSSYYVAHEEIKLPDTDNDYPAIDVDGNTAFSDPHNLDRGHVRDDVIQAAGIVDPNYPPAVSAKTANNEARALVCRQGVPHVPVDPAVDLAYKVIYNAHFSDFEALIKREMAGKELPFTEWVARFEPRRANILIIAYDEYLRLGLSPSDYTIDVFVKKEKLYKVTHGQFAGYNPRCISSMRPKFLVATGPFGHNMKRAMVELLNPQCPVFYTSGHNAATIGHWLERAYATQTADGAYPIFVLCGDLHMLDGHVNKTTEHPVNSLYTKLPDAGAKHLLKVQKRSSSVTKHGLRLATRSRIQSGRIDTNPADTLICAGMAVYATARSSKSPTVLTITDYSEQYSEKAKLRYMGTGDDSVMVVRQSDYSPDFEKAYVDLEMKVKLRAVPLHKTPAGYIGLSQVDYCSALFWPTAGPEKGEGKSQLVLGPKPGRILARLGWDITGAADINAHMRGLALGLVEDTWHVPFAHEYIMKVLALTNAVKAKPAYDEDSSSDGRHKIHVDRRYKTCDQTFLFTLERYGLGQQDLREFVAQLRQVKRLPAQVSSPTIRRLIEVDLEM